MACVYVTMYAYKYRLYICVCVGVCPCVSRHFTRAPFEYLLKSSVCANLRDLGVIVPKLKRTIA